MKSNSPRTRKSPFSAPQTRQLFIGTDDETLSSRQEKQIEALTAGLQKMSAQLELNKLAQQTVASNQ